MTQYAAVAAAVPTTLARRTRRFTFTVRSLLDGVFLGRLTFEVSMPGFEGAAEPDAFEIDGRVATLAEVQALYDWAKDGGSAVAA